MDFNKFFSLFFSPVFEGARVSDAKVIHLRMYHTKVKTWCKRVRNFCRCGCPCPLQSLNRTVSYCVFVSCLFCVCAVFVRARASAHFLLCVCVVFVRARASARLCGTRISNVDSISYHGNMQAPVWHIWLLSAGFFCLFSAYMTAELMQTTINGSSGYLWALIYHKSFSCCIQFLQIPERRRLAGALCPYTVAWSYHPFVHHGWCLPLGQDSSCGPAAWATYSSLPPTSCQITPRSSPSRAHGWGCQQALCGTRSRVM